MREYAGAGANGGGRAGGLGGAGAQRIESVPLLIHCYHGADRTGLIAGMYRIVYQGWTVEQVKNEMRHGPYGFHCIWRNIEDLFTEQNVQEVRAHLQQLRAQAGK